MPYNPLRDMVMLPDGSVYEPGEVIYDSYWQENPFKWESWGKSSFVEMFVGLRPGLERA